MAREEERRRLRRDLHDGVGPALAGMAMQVRAARKLVAGQPRGRQTARYARRRPDRLHRPRYAGSSTSSVRRLSTRASRPRCASSAGASPTRPPTVQLELIGDLDGLPAAVEVAAYRIVAEALTNVARHSSARTCVVTVSRQRSLVLEIVDDGVGITTPAGAGVGLSSMRERAAELGGDCVDRPGRAPRNGDPGPTADHRGSARIR